MAVTFRLDRHKGSGEQIVEVLLDGQVAAVIYPGMTENSIRVISAHFKSRPDDDHMPDPVINDGRDVPFIAPPIPMIEMGFSLRHYNIVDGKLAFVKGPMG